MVVSDLIWRVVDLGLRGSVGVRYVVGWRICDGWLWSIIGRNGLWNAVGNHQGAVRRSGCWSAVGNNWIIVRRKGWTVKRCVGIVRRGMGTVRRGGGTGRSCRGLYDGSGGVAGALYNSVTGYEGSGL